MIDPMLRCFNYTIFGEPRTKKNSSQIVQNPKTGRYFITPSKYYKDFCKECIKQINAWPDRPSEPINYPVMITYTFYKQTRRLVDGLNLCAAMDDILTQAGVISEDNRDIVVGHDGTRVYWDKDNPRVEITITEVNNWERWSDAKSKKK